MSVHEAMFLQICDEVDNCRFDSAFIVSKVDTKGFLLR
jgi:hypothetical protein